MQISVRRRRSISWLALLAMLAATLLPSLTHAFFPTAASNGSWIEICTQQGMQRIAVPADGEVPLGAPPALGTQLDHCAFCVQGGAFDLLTAGRSKLPAAADEDTRYARPQPALHKLDALRGAQPRGPPIDS